MSAAVGSVRRLWRKARHFNHNATTNLVGHFVARFQEAIACELPWQQRGDEPSTQPEGQSPHNFWAHKPLSKSGSSTDLAARQSVHLKASVVSKQPYPC
jgi:hypothetical protein